MHPDFAELEAQSLFELARDTRSLADSVPQNYRQEAIIASRIILAQAKADEGTSRLACIGIFVAVVGVCVTVVGIYVAIAIAHSRI